MGKLYLHLLTYQLGSESEQQLLPNKSRRVWQTK